MGWVCEDFVVFELAHPDTPHWCLSKMAGLCVG